MWVFLFCFVLSVNLKQVNFGKGECLVYSKYSIHVQSSIADVLFWRHVHTLRNRIVLFLWEWPNNLLLRANKIMTFPKGMGE